MNDQNIKIGVLMGGYSHERDISLKSGNAIYKALIESGINAIAIDINERHEKAITDTIASYSVDCAFIALHGQLGEDGAIQEILDKLNIPYTGTGPAASRLILDKVLCNEFLRTNNFSVLPSISFKNKQVNTQDIKDLHFEPYIVKPVKNGSSIGITITHSKESLLGAIDLAFNFDDHVMVEQYISGREVTVGILNDQALPIVEIKPKSSFFDFAAKYSKGITEYEVPAKLNMSKTREIQKIAIDVHNILGCEDFSRVDFILDDNLRPYILEVNTIPGFTETSLLPKAALNAGIQFNQLCEQLIKKAYAKKKEKQNCSVSS